MRKSRLFILVNGTWKEVDLFNDISIPLNYSVSDIQDISKRNTSYSLNIDLPNTKNNAEVFNYIFKIEQLPVSGSFEMLQKYEAVLEVDNTTVFDGYFKLEKVLIDDLKSVTYKGILYDNVKNFVEILGNQTLRGNSVSSNDLDFSTYKTTAANMTLGYMRDKLNTFPSSGGYGLTLIDKTNKAAENFSTNYQNWYSDELTPYLTVKEIWDKIFQQAGYAYESDFLDGGTVPSGYPDFTKLIYPYPNNNNKLGDTGNFQKITSGGSFDWITTYFNMNVPYDIMFGNSGNYIDFPSSYTLTDKNMSGTVTHWQFVAPYTSSYHIKFKIPIALKFDLHSYNWDGGTWNPRYTGAVTFGDTTKEYWLHGQLSKIHSGTTTRLAVWGDFKNFESSYTTGSDGKMLVDTLELKYEGDVRLQAGDVIALTTNFQAEVAYYDETWDRWFSYLLYRGTGGWVSVFPYPATVELTQPAGIDVMEITQNQYFGEGQEFDPTYILNPKTKKWDFINSIVKMFNLYIEDIGDKKFRIEPRDLYYATDVKRDFTDRVDTDSINFTRVDTYIYSDVNFKFKQDKDAETEAYNGTYLIPYGEFVFTGALSNGSDSVDISPIFGSTMCGLVNAQTTVLQCPKMYAFKSNSDVVNVDKEYSDRIFYAWQNNMYSHASSNYGVRIKSRYTSSTQTQTSYYCADILNAGYGSDTQVLSWGDNEVYLENTLDSTVSSSNLYNRFYRQMLAEFNDTEARILTCKMFLTPDDIRNLRLSDTIYVNGIDYRITSIKQWEGYDKPTEVQLVKIVRPTTADLPIRIDSFLNTLNLESNAELNVMKGATADDDGASGWVPTPEAGDEEKFLRGDGTWQTVETGNTYTGVAPIDITNTEISLNVGGGLQVGDHDELTVKLDSTTMTLNTNGEITAYIPDIRVKHINYIDDVFDSKDFNWLDIVGTRDMTIVVNDYSTVDDFNTYRYFRLDTSNPEEENFYIFETPKQLLYYRNDNTWSISNKPATVDKIKIGLTAVNPNGGGEIQLAAGSNITLTPSGNQITIAADAGVTKLQSNGIDVEPTNGAVNLVSGNNMLFLTSGNSITIDAPSVSDFVDTQDDAYIIYYLVAGTAPLSNSWITAYTYTSVNTYNQTTGVGRFYLKPNAVLGGADTPFGSNTNLLEVNLVYSHLTTIGRRAFYGCSSLTKVTFGTQVLTIGRQCFQNCTSLTTMVGWSGIQTIGSGAFYNCGFTSLDFNSDSNVETIGQGAFSSCTSLTTVNLTARTTFYGTDVFQNCTALTSVTFRGQMQRIPMYMFYGCTALTTISIPLGVTVIEYRAFYGCTSLTDITLSKTIASIDSEAFGSIGADYTVTCNAVTMPFVGDDAFSVHS